MNRLRPLVGTLLVAAMAVGAALVPGGLAVGSGSGPAHAAAAPATLSPSVGVPRFPNAVGCPLGPPPFPQPTVLLGNVFPLDPNFYLQNPCPLIQQDEVHAAFASPAAGSGTHLTVPWYLPPEGPSGQENATSGAYLGMVVTGDPYSEGNQSYLEVVAEPTGARATFEWHLELAVLSFVNYTKLQGTNPFCSNGQNLSYNYSYFCEIDDLTGGAPIPLFTSTGGAWVSVSFDGQVGGSKALQVWVNETGDGNATKALTLNSTTTGTYAFEPYYSAACVDACELSWGLADGLGIGVTPCPGFTSIVSQCDSYNETVWPSLPAFEWGAPEFFENGSYSGDYQFFSPESASGVCNTAPPNGVIVATCYDFTNGGGTGFYPYFSLNGNLTSSWVSFGTTHPTARTLWEQDGQYSLGPTQEDERPIVVSDLTDSSQAGYLASGLPLNVTAHATAWGSVTAASLAYSVNGSAFVTEPVARTAGTAADGVYSGQVPSGPDGRIVYYLNATGGSGDVATSGAVTVVRGPVPTFTLSVGIVPAGCGSVQIDGQSLSNGSTLPIPPGVYSTVATGCYPYVFSSWVTTGRVVAANPLAETTNATVRGSGGLTATFRYLRPTENITVLAVPGGCGLVTLNGTDWANDTVVGIPYGLPAPLGEIDTCAGYSFSGWTVGGNLTVLGGAVTPYGNGTLTANYIPTAGSFSVTFQTIPVGCGGIQLNGAGYENGQVLAEDTGSYPIAPAPCRHWGFENFSTTGGLSIFAGVLTVSGTGVVTELNYHLTELFIDTSPSYCGGLTIDGVNYTNGADLAVQNNSVYTVGGFSCAGHYLQSVTASGNLSLSGTFLTVNGSGTILVISLTGSPEAFVGFITNPPTCGSVSLGGNSYPNGGNTEVAPGSVFPITAFACANYGFVRFATSGGISVAGGTAYVNGSGSIEAYFGSLVTLIVNTIPSTCGSVLFDGIGYTNDEAVTLINGVSYSIGAVPCVHYALSEFESSPFVAIANGTITPSGPSTITAVFDLAPYTVSVAATGLGCGTILVNRLPVAPGGSVMLPFGSYPVAAQSCRTSEFGGWTSNGSLAVVGSTLYVNGTGNLTAAFGLLPPEATLAGPSVAYAGSAVPFFAAVLVPVAPTGYVFVWTFGDGGSTQTSTNSTTHTYANAGTYVVRVTVTDPYQRTANATLNLTVDGSASAAASNTALANGLLAAGIAAVVLVAVWLLGTRRPKRPAAAAAKPAPKAPAPPP